MRIDENAVDGVGAGRVANKPAGSHRGHNGCKQKDMNHTAIWRTLFCGLFHMHTPKNNLSKAYFHSGDVGDSL
jgi:hypothetical protein